MERTSFICAAVHRLARRCWLALTCRLRQRHLLAEARRAAPAARAPKGSAASCSSRSTLRSMLLNEGFIAALDDAGISYEADQQNANNEQRRLAPPSRLDLRERRCRPHPGHRHARSPGLPERHLTENIPIVGTAITDFAESNSWSRTTLRAELTGSLRYDARRRP